MVISNDHRKKINKRSGWLWLIAGLLTLAAAVQSQSIDFLQSKTMTPVGRQSERAADPNEPHIPVFIRQGKIVELGVDYLMIETEKLVGVGSERIIGLFMQDTQVIEIQIPRIMTPELQNFIIKEGDAKFRTQVERDKLFVGQAVDVISSSDMYGLSEVVLNRVEYKVVVDTGGNI